jgi:hypothetical protein
MGLAAGPFLLPSAPLTPGPELVEEAGLKAMRAMAVEKKLRRDRDAAQTLKDYEAKSSLLSPRHDVCEQHGWQAVARPL